MLIKFDEMEQKNRKKFLLLNVLQSGIIEMWEIEATYIEKPDIGT
jgi:hypothetical protein